MILDNIVKKDRQEFEIKYTEFTQQMKRMKKE